MIMTQRIYGERKIERLLGINSRAVEFMAAAAMGVLAVHWSLIIWFILPRLGSLDFLRLHYTAALGVDWIGAWWMIFVFPAFGLALFFVNALFAGMLAVRYRSFPPIMMAMTLFLESVAAVGGVMALLLNG